MNFSVRFFIKTETKGKEKPVYAIVRKTGMRPPVKRSTGMRIVRKDWTNKGGWPTNTKDNNKLDKRLRMIRSQMKGWFHGLSDPSEATRSRILEKLEKVISGDTAVGGKNSLFEHFAPKKVGQFVRNFHHPIPEGLLCDGP